MNEWDRDDNGPDTTGHPAEHTEYITAERSMAFTIPPDLMYHCPVHGEVAELMSVSVENWDSADYCMRCIIEKMDELIGRVEVVNNDN